MSVITYKCPNCGGELLFDPESQKFKCEYCLSSFEEGELQNPEESTSIGSEPKTTYSSRTQQEEQEAVVYHCPNCGAEIITDATTAATFCFYCHNPVILSGRLDGSLKPDCIIPFSIEKEEAIKRFTEWIGKKKFVPHAFFPKTKLKRSQESIFLIGPSTYR